MHKTTTCVHFVYGVLCFSPRFRLRLSDGRHIFMDWHRHCGPTFYFDRAMNREIEAWWDDLAITEALNWFQSRGWALVVEPFTDKTLGLIGRVVLG